MCERERELARHTQEDLLNNTNEEEEEEANIHTNIPRKHTNIKFNFKHTFFIYFS